jgi:succinate-semialdehyde dehydrogenase/glutarate-semialdehyde dehydrogenase
VYDQFVEKFAAKVKTAKVGNGFEDGVNQGPLIEEAALEKVQRHVDDAMAKGGKVLAGGKRLKPGFRASSSSPPWWPTPRADMLCAREETFGPFAPVFKFKTEQEAIDAANNTEFGLASYFYSRDVGRIFRVSEALEYGMVGINVGILATEHVPFGGVKQSGLGREGSHHGMDDYVEIKYLCMGDIAAGVWPGRPRGGHGRPGQPQDARTCDAADAVLHCFQRQAGDGGGHAAAGAGRQAQAQ